MISYDYMHSADPGRIMHNMATTHIMRAYIPRCLFVHINCYMSHCYALYQQLYISHTWNEWSLICNHWTLHGYEWIKTDVTSCIHSQRATWYIKGQISSRRQILWWWKYRHSPYIMNGSSEPLSRGCHGIFSCAVASLALNWIIQGIETTKRVSHS